MPHKVAFQKAFMVEKPINMHAIIVCYQLIIH